MVELMLSISTRELCQYQGLSQQLIIEVVDHGIARPVKGKDVVDWAREVANLGAGEILLTSMDADGTKNGYDVPMTKAVCDAVNIPVIASGGAGKLEDFAEIFEETSADAALAASIFHYNEIPISKVKAYLQTKKVEVRL